MSNIPDKIKFTNRGQIATKDEFGFNDYAEQIEDKIFMIVSKLNEIIDYLKSHE